MRLGRSSVGSATNLGPCVSLWTARPNLRTQASYFGATIIPPEYWSPTRGKSGQSARGAQPLFATTMRRRCASLCPRSLRTSFCFARTVWSIGYQYSRRSCRTSHVRSHQVIVFGFSSCGREVPFDPSGQTGYFLLTSSRSPEGALPNKRLKLAGGDRSKGSGVLCAGAHELSFRMPLSGA